MRDVIAVADSGCRQRLPTGTPARIKCPTGGAFGSGFFLARGTPSRSPAEGSGPAPLVVHGPTAAGRWRSPETFVPCKCYMLNGHWSKSPTRGTRDNRRRRKDGSARVGRGALPRATSYATAPPSRRAARSGDRTRRVVPNATACALELPRTEASDQVELIGIAP